MLYATYGISGGGIEGHAPFSLPFTDDILMHWS